MTAFTMLGLKTEYGVTETSLENAGKLIDEYGVPRYIVLRVQGQEQEVVAKWEGFDGLVTYIFNGFSWGYRGEGPHGLQKFLKWCDIDVSIDDIASWSRTIGRVIR